MKRITGVEEQRGNKKRVNIFLEGQFAFSLNQDIAREKGLRTGICLSDEETLELVNADDFLKTYETAIRFLSYRPRSEAEVRRRLYRGRFEESQIERTIARLKELQAIDDGSFALFWIENRQTFRPRGRRLIKSELLQKGIDSETINETLATVDDESNAYEAAVRKARTLTTDDYSTFRDKLGAFLQRRGFSYHDIRLVTARLWEERKPG